MRSTRLKYVWAALLLLCTLAVGLFILFPSLPDPECRSLIANSLGEVPIPLPADCVQVASIDSDSMTRYLENERNRRGLIFQEWIVCKEAPKEGFAFMNAPYWLPSHVPATYQYRRTVIIVPYAQPIPGNSPVVGEICLTPWRKYIRQIAGQCNEKYLVWK